MKVAITGHTKNTGAAIAKEFSANGYEVLGFSRSNGYNLADRSILNRVIDEIDSADIFINNAYVHDSQTILLKRIIELWKDTDKTIIHIGSIAALSPLEFYLDHFGDTEFRRIYYQNKKEQLEIINGMLMFSTQRISHVIPGLILTDHHHNKVFPVQPMAVESVAKVVYNLSTADSDSFIQQAVISNLNT